MTAATNDIRHDADFNDASFDPIMQRSVAEQVAQRLLTMIRTGALQREQRLPPERELATLLGVGRPAVREAIRGLSLLGLLKIRQGEGTFVGSLSPRELLEPMERVIELNPGSLDALFDARIVLESSIAAFAAERISDSALRRLQDGMRDEAALLADPKVFAAADMAFHDAIIEACGNPYLQSMAASLHALGRRSRAITATIPMVPQRSVEDHRRIVDALAARSPERAAEAMRTHLTQVRDSYFSAHREPS